MIIKIHDKNCEKIKRKLKIHFTCVAILQRKFMDPQQDFDYWLAFFLTMS